MCLVYIHIDSVNCTHTHRVLCLQGLGSGSSDQQKRPRAAALWSSQTYKGRNTHAVNSASAIRVHDEDTEITMTTLAGCLHKPFGLRVCWCVWSRAATCSLINPIISLLLSHSSTPRSFSCLLLSPSSSSASVAAFLLAELCAIFNLKDLKTTI